MSNPPEYALPNPLLPQADESLVGCLVRNAEAYRFWDPARLLKRIRPPKLVLWSICDTDPNEPFGLRLRHLLGLDEPTFRRLSPWTGGENAISILGQPVWRALARPALRAVCPRCLQEAAYHRAAWFLDTMPVCATHGVWLRHCCHRCERPLTWTGSSVHTCGTRGCRCDLREAPAEKANPAHLAGISALHRLLHSGATHAPHGMPFGEALRVAFYFGRMALGFERISDTRRFIQDERHRMPELLDAGWRALDDLPLGFDGLLRQLSARRHDRRGRGGLRKAFGRLSSQVFHWSKEPWGRPIAQAFAEHVAQREDLAVSTRVLERYGATAALQKRHMTFSEACEALDISALSMQRLAKRMDLYLVPPDGVGVPSVMDASAVRRLQTERQTSLFAEEARKLVGVGRKIFEQLEKSGLLPRIPEAQRIIEMRAFRQGDVEAFVASCRGAAMRMTRRAARERGYWTLPSAVAPGRTAADICRALRDGHLAAAALVPDTSGLGGIRLDPEAVVRVLPEKKATMSAVEVGHLLGVHYGDVLAWARRGFITSMVKPGHREVGLRFTEADVAAFSKTYVTGGELSREHWQRGNGSITRHLQFLGVRPVSDRKTAKGSRGLFRRADLTPEVLEQLGRGRGRGRGAGAPTTREVRRQGYERVESVGAIIGRSWGAPLTRMNNRFTDLATGRAVQVLSGRRPFRTGAFRFNVQKASLVRLRQAGEAYVALVPSEGCCFLLLPLERLPLRGGGPGGRGKSNHLTVSFDGQGRPLEMAEWAVPMSEGAFAGASP